MLVYNGGNFNTAKQTALQFASSVSIEEDYFGDLKVFRQNDGIALQTSTSTVDDLSVVLYNIAGKQEQVWTELELGQSGYRLTVNKSLNSAVYLLRLTSHGKEVTKRLVWAN